MPDPRKRLEEAARFELDGFLDRALDEYQIVIASTDEPALVCEALRRQSDVHRTRCAWEAALDAARRSADIAKRSGFRDLFAEAVNAEGLVHLERGDLDAASEHFERVQEEAAAPRVRGIALQNLGTVAFLRRDFDGAERHYRSSREQFRAAGYRRGEAIALNNLGRAALERGVHPLAEDLLEEASVIARQVGDADLFALATLNRAEARLSGGGLVDAEAAISSALGYFSIASNNWRRVECFRLLGDLRARQEDAAGARRCYRVGLEIAERIGARIEAAQLGERLAMVPVAT